MTQHFVLCRNVVLFWRLLCIKCVYKCTISLSIGRRFFLFRSVLYRRLHCTSLMRPVPTGPWSATYIEFCSNNLRNMATSLMRTLAPVYFTSSETPNLVASNIAELILSLTYSLFTLANGTVLDRFGPPTRGGTVPPGTVRFGTVSHPFTLR